LQELIIWIASEKKRPDFVIIENRRRFWPTAFALVEIIKTRHNGLIAKAKIHPPQFLSEHDNVWRLVNHRFSETGFLPTSE